MQVMILDWDVHHGNGTNDLFYDDDSVLMVDMHEDGVWPGSGLLTEVGAGKGQGHTINIPMPSKTLLSCVYQHQCQATECRLSGHECNDPLNLCTQPG